MIRQGVILAAGMGQRLRAHDNDPPKPLHVAAGRTLVNRTLMTFARAGIERILVVIGFMGDDVRAAIEADAEVASASVDIDFVVNADYQLGLGLSVLCARGRTEGPFVLSMSDHVYEPALVELAMAADMSAADLYLCVDHRIEQVYDIDDATKVRTRDGAIAEIGKELTDYDAVDCGVFSVTPALLACLAEARDAQGDCSLSDGVQRLAKRGRARVLDIDGAFWQDVDTPGALERAETLLAPARLAPTARRREPS